MRRAATVVGGVAALVGVGAGPALALSASQQARLFSPEAMAEDIFGRGLSIDADTLVAGSPALGSAQASRTGSAYAFVRNAGSWSLQQELTPSDAAVNDSIGTSTAVFGDTALVSARLDDNERGANAGAVYVFVRAGSTWTQQAKLRANDGAEGDQFGLSVDIDGETAVIGAFNDDTAGGSNTGSAYVFTRSGSTWSQQAQLLPTGAAAGDLFGRSVAVSGDTALVGGESDDTAAGSNAGSAAVFTRTGSSWSQQAQLFGSDASPEDNFGIDVSLDADTALVGAPIAAGGGAAYVYVRTGTSWAEQARLSRSGTSAGGELGDNVALQGDTAVVGDIVGTNSAGLGTGTETVFLRSGATWTEDVTFVAEQAEDGDLFSFPTALDDGTVVVGATRDDDRGNNSGSVYVYTLADDAPPPVVPEAPVVALLPALAAGLVVVTLVSRRRNREPQATPIRASR